MKIFFNSFQKKSRRIQRSLSSVLLTIQLTALSLPLPSSAFLGEALNELSAQHQQGQFESQLQGLHVLNRQVPDDLGLGCQMLPTTLPNGPSCAGQDPMLAQRTMGIYQENARTYEEQLAPGRHTQTPMGPACLENRLTELDNFLASEEERLQDFLKQQQEGVDFFFNGIDQSLSEIKAMNAYLYGGPGPIEQEELDYSKFLSDSSCSESLTKSGLNRQGRQGGLMGIQDHFTPRVQAAREVQKTDFDGIEVQKALDHVLSGNGQGLPPSVTSIHNQYRTRLEELVANRSLGIFGQIPTQLDETFLDRLEVRSEQIDRPGAFTDMNRPENQFFDHCLKEGLGSIRVKSSRSRGENIASQRYQARVRELFEMNISVSEKIKYLKKITDRDSRRDLYVVERGKGPVSIGKYYRSITNRCQTELSQQRKNALDTVKQIRRDFQETLKDAKKAIEKKIVQCEGIPYRPTPSQCSEGQNGALNPTSPSFCKGHALQCAKSVTACSHRLEAEIRMLQLHRDEVAFNINESIQAHRNQLNLALGQVLAATTSLTMELQRKYPLLPSLSFGETPFSIADLTLQKDQALKVSLLEGASPEKIKEGLQLTLSGTISSLKNYREALKEQVGKQIEKRKEAYELSMGKWTDMANQCSSAMEIMRTAQEQQAQEKAKMQEQQAQDLQNAARLCYALDQQKARGCDDERIEGIVDLYDELSMNLGSNFKDREILEQYRASCSSSSEEDTEGQEAVRRSLVGKLCQVTIKDDHILPGFDGDKLNKLFENYSLDEQKKESIREECEEMRQLYFNQYKSEKEAHDDCKKQTSQNGRSCSFPNIMTLREQAIKGAGFEIFQIVQEVMQGERKNQNLGEMEDLPLCGFVNETIRGEDSNPDSQEEQADDLGGSSIIPQND